MPVASWDPIGQQRCLGSENSLYSDLKQPRRWRIWNKLRPFYDNSEQKPLAAGQEDMFLRMPCLQMEEHFIIAIEVTDLGKREQQGLKLEEISLVILL